MNSTNSERVIEVPISHDNVKSALMSFLYTFGYVKADEEITELEGILVAERLKIKIKKDEEVTAKKHNGKGLRKRVP